MVYTYRMNTINRTAKAARQPLVAYRALELGGVRYAVVEESALSRACARAGVRLVETGASSKPSAAQREEEPYDGEMLAERIAQRRKAAGLTQAQLASRAGIRLETLNRIERGKTTPDFSTIRKLVHAVQEAEAAKQQ
jgi:DNA-binding XRE family transcriptional regulator